LTITAQLRDVLTKHRRQQTALSIDFLVLSHFDPILDNNNAGIGRGRMCLQEKGHTKKEGRNMKIASPARQIERRAV